MMPDGDTAAHLRKQVGGLFFVHLVFSEKNRPGFRLDQNWRVAIVASCPFLLGRTDILQARREVCF